jgi:hypothetical protein
LAHSHAIAQKVQALLVISGAAPAGGGTAAPAEVTPQPVPEPAGFEIAGSFEGKDAALVALNQKFVEMLRTTLKSSGNKGSLAVRDDPSRVAQTCAARCTFFVFVLVAYVPYRCTCVKRHGCNSTCVKRHGCINTCVTYAAHV